MASSISGGKINSGLVHCNVKLKQIVENHAEKIAMELMHRLSKQQDMFKGMSRGGDGEGWMEGYEGVRGWLSM